MKIHVLKEYFIKRHYKTRHAIQISGTQQNEKQKHLSFNTVLLNSKCYSVSTAVCARYMVTAMLTTITELSDKREIVILKLIYPN
jgi:phosphotransferase system IIA component